MSSVAATAPKTSQLSAPPSRTSNDNDDANTYGSNDVYNNLDEVYGDGNLLPANAGRLEARARELRGDTGFIDGHARRPCLAVGPLFRSGDPSNILYSRLSPLVVLLRHT